MFQITHTLIGTGIGASLSESLAQRIGRRISKLRQLRGLNAEQLAYQHDFSKATISLLERGKTNPSLPMLTKIAAALEVSVVDLIPANYPQRTDLAGEFRDIFLDDKSWKEAERIGSGDPSEGIRKALQHFNDA